MRKNFLLLLIVFLTGVMAVGCNGNKTTGNNSESKNPLDDFMDIDPVVSDLVIMGQPIDEMESVYDITGEIQVEGYSIVCAYPYGENEVIVIYAGESDSIANIYDISDGKISKNIVMKDVLLSKNATIKVVSEDFAYIEELSENRLVYLDLKIEEYRTIALEEHPTSFVMPGEGDAFYYTVEGDCNVYQYIADTGNSFSVFDASDMLDNIELKYVVQGVNSLVVYVKSQGYNGYAMLSIEMQELSPMEGIEGKFYYDGTEYVYTSPENEPVLHIYNPMTPRLNTKFNVDFPEEMNDVRLFRNNTCFLTVMEKDSKVVLRYYSLNEGILKNQLELDDSPVIGGTIDFDNSDIVMIESADETQNKHVLIWNTQIIKEVLE